jgi:hypothetical protein
MRRRLLIVTVVLLTAVGSSLLLLRAGSGEVPEIRLSQAPHLPDGAYVRVPPSTARIPFGVTGLSPELRTARFEILAPSVGIVLTNGPIGVEMQDANGDAIGAGTCCWSPLQAQMESVFRRTVTRTELPISPSAASVRFSIGFRRLTLEQRAHMAFAKWGLSRKLPRLSSWVVKCLPSTEWWLVHQVEVQLPPLPVDSETHNNQTVERADAPLLRSDAE